MEILTAGTTVMTTSGVFIICALGILSGLMLIAIYSITKLKNDILLIIIGVMTMCFVLGAAICPKEEPTKYVRYTVEITEVEKYKELLDKGYVFEEKVYVDKDIYVIKGESLE